MSKVPNHVLKRTILFGFLVFSILLAILSAEVFYSNRHRLNTEMEIVGNNELQNIMLSVQLEYILEDLLYLYGQSILRTTDSR